MVSALGVDIRRLFMIVFGFGTMLAGFAGVMIAPILSVEPGMGDSILILAFVVIVIGGIGSIRGAFIAALLIGLVDTLGRSFAIDILRLVLPPSPARTVGPAIASMLIYLLMAVVLYFRPAGLFPAQGTLMATLATAGARGSRRGSIEIAAGRDLSRSGAGAAGRRVRRRNLSARPVHARDDLRHRRARARLSSAATAGWSPSATPPSSASAPMRSASSARTASPTCAISLPVALAVSALFALLTGTVCLRTAASISS